MFLNIKSVFWLSIQILPEIFFTPRITEGDMIKRIHLRYSLFLTDFNKTWILLDIFSEKYSNIKLHKHPLTLKPSCFVRTDRRTRRRYFYAISWTSLKNPHSCPSITKHTQTHTFSLLPSYNPRFFRYPFICSQFYQTSWSTATTVAALWFWGWPRSW